MFGFALGPRWLAFLQQRQFGKQLNPSEPEEHAHKAGTPTMGGIVFLIPVMTVISAYCLHAGVWDVLIPLGVALAFGTLGIVDDLRTLVGKTRSAGLSPAVKWVVQIIVSIAAAYAIQLSGRGLVHVPFFGVLPLPWWGYIVFAAFVLVATTSSVAITDGLDSLAATTCSLAFVAFWVIAATRGDVTTATLCATLVGGILAYLWFNAFPAQMWMGDAGSLPLGGLLGVIALLLGEPFLLIPAGVVFVANALADIAQVLSMKIRGRRILRYAPLHHHFERVGWKETWVVQRFWIAGAVGALVAILASQQ